MVHNGRHNCGHVECDVYVRRDLLSIISGLCLAVLQTGHETSPVVLLDLYLSFTLSIFNLFQPRLHFKYVKISCRCTVH